MTAYYCGVGAVFLMSVVYELAYYIGYKAGLRHMGNEMIKLEKEGKIKVIR